jgi:tetratricopeptide (TPR) repeat protein
MTSPASSPSPKFFPDRRGRAVAMAAALSILLLSSCAGSGDDVRRHHGKAPSAVWTRFEWGVQNYEAGDYQKAIAGFESLRKEGPAVPDYDLLPYYLGMSHYHLGQYPDAARELEAFLRAGASRQEAQDARLTLLLTYEKLGRWDDATALAVETDKLTLFQYNRALLKLVWAHALRERGELLGAKAALDEAEPYLDKVSTEDGGQPLYADADQDLWGRYHYTSVLVEEMECGRLTPKEIGVAAKPGKKGRKARPLKRLYAPWLEAVTDCQRKAIAHASQEIFSHDSPWAPKAEAALTQGIEAFGERVRDYLRQESAALEKHRALEKTARENFYRLLSSVEDQIKIFKNRGLNSESLEAIRKKIDPLIVSLSHPS